MGNLRKKYTEEEWEDLINQYPKTPNKSFKYEDTNLPPKEKALSLLRSFQGITGAEGKECALLCVKEVVSQWFYIDTYLADMNGEFNPNYKYWLQVEIELKKL